MGVVISTVNGDYKLTYNWQGHHLAGVMEIPEKLRYGKGNHSDIGSLEDSGEIKISMENHHFCQVNQRKNGWVN